MSSRDRDAVILKQVYEPNPDGSYVYRYILQLLYLVVSILIVVILIRLFSYETSNGIRADQQGYLKNPGTQIEAQVIGR